MVDTELYHSKIDYAGKISSGRNFLTWKILMSAEHVGKVFFSKESFEKRILLEKQTNCLKLFKKLT